MKRKPHWSDCIPACDKGAKFLRRYKTPDRAWKNCKDPNFMRWALRHLTDFNYDAIYSITDGLRVRHAIKEDDYVGMCRAYRYAFPSLTPFLSPIYKRKLRKVL